MSPGPDLVEAEVAIVGAGVAGLAAALASRPRRVAVLTRARPGDGGSSPLAQGGIAAAVGEGDSPEAHAADTIRAGCGLCDPRVVRLVTTEGPHRVGELVALGARFDRDREGRLALAREAAHSRARVVHADGDATGAEIVRILATALAAERRVELVVASARDLILDRGRVVGLVADARDGRPLVVASPAVCLATGGLGGLYRHTTNPADATGTGIALAARAGARLAGLELVQFHPTALADASRPMALLTEALRGAGAVLVDGRGERFMLAEHPLAELAPRDVVARAIWRRREAGEEILLDATGLGPRLEQRFPTVVGLCRERGLEPACEPIPVVPAAHYAIGGVVTDEHGRTSVPGLWACGEVASTGLHGANRLASNSLLEALVFGARVGETLTTLPLPAPDRWRAVAAVESTAPAVAARRWRFSEALHRRLEATMWRRVGLVRSASGLTTALDELTELEHEVTAGDRELADAILVARLVARAALARTESRGAHCRSDFPRECPAWRQPVLFEGERQVDPRPLARRASG